MSRKDEFEDNMHLILNLLPTFLPLSIVRKVTEEMLQKLLHDHEINLQIFLDGSKQVMKEETKNSRDEGRAQEESNFRTFFTKKVLPPSCRPKRKHKKSKQRPTFVVPDAHALLNEFPLPPLLFSEVYHTFRVLEARSGSSSSTIKVTTCDGEADQPVAMASALDVTNATYAVGLDSDYCMFGFPLDHELWVMGDLHVQYLSLETLIIDQETLQGFVITKEDIARELDMSEDMLTEASLLMGNDYTSHFVNGDATVMKKRKHINFFRDHFEPSSKLTWPKVIEYMSELGSDFRVHSDEHNQEAAICFSRDLYRMQDMTHYLEDDDDSGDDDDDDEDSGRIMVEWLDGEYGSSCENLKAHIFALLSTSNASALCENDDIMITTLMQASDHMHGQGWEDGKHGLLPYGLKWDPDVRLSIFLQRCISDVWKKRCAVLSVEAVHAPSQIFHHSYFFRAIMAHTRQDNSGSSDFMKPTTLVDSSEKRSQEFPRKQLPIDTHRDDIIQSVANNRVTVIQGETGSGKSTRVPVMLLESPPPDPRVKEVKMFICQPRRIAAKSLTERLRSTEPHLRDLIGLRMGHGVKEHETNKTRAWFVTAGYLVRYLANNSEAFSAFSHLIIDECHERSVDNDVLCLLAKRLLATNPTIRIILMSATVAADMYQEYFNVNRPPIFVGVRCHPIKEYFVEDIADRFKFSPKERNNLTTIAEKCIASKCQTSPNAHFMGMLHRAAVSIAVEVSSEESAVLIFVPGMADIISIMEIFEDLVINDKVYKCIPIHSDLPFEDQLTVFDVSVDGEIKIVIATNAAESSLTLPDVDHVICFGLCKTIQYNKKSHRQVLELSWISRANATQRAGRTGRVREGNVYRLYPRQAFDEFFDPFEEGEILRSPLDSVILDLRTIKDDEPVSELLLSCIEPPDLQNIENSFVSLHTRKFITEPSDNFGITSLGKMVALLGIDLALGAMIGLGFQLGLLAETVELAAILSLSKTPWLLPNALLQEPEQYNDIVSKTFVSKSRFDKGLFSEAYGIMNLLYNFDRCKNRHSFCRDHSLSYPRISRLAKMRDNLRHRTANAFRVDVSTLCPKNPPHKINASKLAALYAIQVWIFRDAVIELLPQTKKRLSDNGDFSLELGGDEIKKHHLDTIFDERRHRFKLKSEIKETYVGKYKPMEIDGELRILTNKEFQERLVSFSIERGFEMMITRTGKHLELFVSSQKHNDLLPLLQNAYRPEEVLLCEKNVNNRRGWKERAFGAWNISYRGTSENIKLDYYKTMTFVRFLPKEEINTGGAKKNFRRLRELFKSSCPENVSVLFLGRDSIWESKFDLFCLGPNKHDFKATDFTDLFVTPNIGMKLLHGSKRQKIVFSAKSDEDVNTDGFLPLVSNVLPEGVRILEALLSGRRKNRVIYFLDSCENENENDQSLDKDSYVEVRLVRKDSNHTRKWKWVETNGDVFLDSFSIPASVAPQDTESIFACCGNILELNGGRLLAENLTLLPFGQQFLTIARRCFADPDEEQTEELADADTFRSIFWDTFSADSDFEFSAQSVTLFCKAFNVIDGFELTPWGTEDINVCDEYQKNDLSQLPVDETNALKFVDNVFKMSQSKQVTEEIKKQDKENHKALARVLCDKLGNDVIPSSFAQLCYTEGQSDEKKCTDDILGLKSKKEKREARSKQKQDGSMKYKCPSTNYSSNEFGTDAKTGANSDTKGLAQLLRNELGNDVIPSSIAQLCNTQGLSAENRCIDDIFELNSKKEKRESKLAQEHDKATRYQCPLQCGTTPLEGSEELMKHMLSVHHKKYRGFLESEVCLINLPQSKKVQRPLFQCHLCSLKPLKWTTLDKHMRLKHSYTAAHFRGEKI